MTTISLTPRAAREQQTFRVLLNAMARPGSIDLVPLHDLGGEYAAALSVIEGLADHEVSFAVVPERADLIDAVLRQTGSRLAAPEEAAYVLCESGSLARTLELVKDGTLEQPDTSATVICRVLDIGAGEDRLVLAGPGIKDRAVLTLDGFDPEAQAIFSDRNSQPPLGVDVVFVSPDGKIACLGRYTKLTKEDE